VSSHPVVLALFDEAARAADAARALRALGVAPERVSIVARTHDEEGVVARASDASPGSELEDSGAASRLGELGAHLLAAIAIVMPGIGPIVADGPLAAGLGEAAGHLAGGLGRALEHAGLARADAHEWEAQVRQGAFLVGAHTTPSAIQQVQDVLARAGSRRIEVGTWQD
jgi:hypothetical protein